MKSPTTALGIGCAGHSVSVGYAQTRVREAFDRMKAREHAVHAFVDHDAQVALEQARTLDRTRVTSRGPLHGVRLAVKEIFDVQGLRCTLGSPLFANRRPDATAGLVARMRDAGAIIIGTTVSTEFAIAAPGPTRNPRDPSRTPGGSSSGSAAAVAAGMVDLALGSQTIGSTIRPAAYCGVFGFKPTHGLIDTGDGRLVLSPPLDHVGFLARDIDHIEQALLAFYATPPTPVPSLTGVRRVEPWFPEPVAPIVTTALDDAGTAFESLGVTCRTHQLPPAIQVEARVTETLLFHDMQRYIAPRISVEDHRVSPELTEMLRKGARTSASTYGQALAMRDTLIRLLEETLRPGEVILAPATQDVAPPLAQGTGSKAPQRLWTLCGMPALSVPMGLHRGLPVGVQLVGRRGEDGVVLAAGRALMQARR